MKSVRWEVAGNIVLAWFFTIPGACIVWYVFYAILHLILWA
jgi:PiT family inorganic phosphate transporter